MARILAQKDQIRHQPTQGGTSAKMRNISIGSPVVAVIVFYGISKGICVGHSACQGNVCFMGDKNTFLSGKQYKTNQTARDIRGTELPADKQCQIS